MRQQTKRQRKTKKARRQAKQTKRQRRFLTKRRRLYKGGANLPVPEGSVVAVDLDPQDAYSVPVLVNKATYEEEVLEE